jgi:hypothetical protein
VAQGSEVHIANAVTPIVRTDDGMLIEVGKQQCQNAQFGIIVRA